MNRRRMDALERRFGTESLECDCKLLRCATDEELDRAIQIYQNAGAGELPDADRRQLEEMEAEWRRRYRRDI